MTKNINIKNIDEAFIQLQEALFNIKDEYDKQDNAWRALGFAEGQLGYKPKKLLIKLEEPIGLWRVKKTT